MGSATPTPTQRKRTGTGLGQRGLEKHISVLRTRHEGVRGDSEQPLGGQVLGELDQESLRLRGAQRAQELHLRGCMR